MADIEDLETIIEVLDRAMKAETSANPGVEHGRSVGLMAEIRSRTAALDAEVVGTYDASKEWAGDGHKSSSVGVRHCSPGASQATSRARRSRARKLRDLPVVHDALGAGEISLDAAEVLLRADRPEVHDKLVEDQKVLVDAAKTLEHVDLAKVVKYWEQLADPDGADRDAIDADEGRSAHASQVGDRLRVDAWMTRTGGAEFKAELERLEQKLFEADWAEARERLGDQATGNDLGRSAEQRRCDAMVEMARRSRAHADEAPAPRGRTVLNVHMDYETFCAEWARLMGDDVEYPADRLCELDDGTVLVPSEALNLALGGEIRRIVFGADGHVLDYGRARPFFTGALADAIRARDRRCQMPGCLLPANRCQIDHVHERQHGGETSEANGECLCRFHNLWKTNHLSRYRRLRGWH